MCATLFVSLVDCQSEGRVSVLVLQGDVRSTPQQGLHTPAVAIVGRVHQPRATRLYNTIMHRFIDGHNPCNLHDLTIDYSKNFTTILLLTIDEMSMFVINTFHIQITSQVMDLSIQLNIRPQQILCVIEVTRPSLENDSHPTNFIWAFRCFFFKFQDKNRSTYFHSKINFCLIHCIVLRMWAAELCTSKNVSLCTVEGLKYFLCKSTFFSINFMHLKYTHNSNQ